MSSLRSGVLVVSIRAVEELGCSFAALCGEQVVKEEALLSMEIPNWCGLKGAPPGARLQGLPSVLCRVVGTGT